MEVLQKIALVSLFIDNIQRPICVLHGEKGSAKTSTMKLIRIIARIIYIIVGICGLINIGLLFSHD